MSFQEKLDAVLKSHAQVKNNIPRADLIRDAVENKEAVTAACGALVTWTPTESTGRSPKDTLVVKNPESEHTIDWSAANNIPLDPETFEMLEADALAAIGNLDKIYVNDRIVGADLDYALPVHMVASHALHSVFADNMFRAWDDKVLTQSVFKDRTFTLIALPYEKLDPKRYEGRLRVDPRLGHTSTMAVAINFDKRIGIVYGSAYCGSCKKLIFTVMNYMLPPEGILPLHCSANEGKDGNSALLLGLSGTGKTTLSADVSRALLGDDEHGWDDKGIANFENGCYAKLIDLEQKNEPEIYNACFHHEDDFTKHGAVIENTMMYPDGEFDLFDDRYTPNSRGSYPLRFLENIKEPPIAGHPNIILFLTADANGVIPPISRLSRNQAMLWFLMGYTSKLAGTETGVTEPVSTFSRFFGAPFMPRNPDDYASMLGEKMEKYGSEVYLVNTGWSGGAYGTGKRIKLPLTRAMCNAALNGDLKDVEYVRDPYFKVDVPQTCKGIDDPAMLNPVNTWADKAAFKTRAEKLAQDFAAHYEKAYANKGIAEEIAKECPGI
ncbi:MAG: phosphoenolpyruvate carboxykinase (ATP) [bacterium]|nr:phosphoenolpyruvate carboxykinase (ATP) [bacterium]